MTPRSCVAAETMTRWESHGQKFGDSCDIGTRESGESLPAPLVQPYYACTYLPICSVSPVPGRVFF